MSLKCACFQIKRTKLQHLAVTHAWKVFFSLIRWQGKELRKFPIIPTVIKHCGNLCVTSPCVYWGWIVFTGMRERALVWGESKISTLESSLTISRIAGSLLQISPSTPFFFPNPPSTTSHIISHHHLTHSVSEWCGFKSQSGPESKKKNACKPQKEPFRVVTKDKTVTSETEAIVTTRHRLHRFKSICSKRFCVFFFFHTFQNRYQTFCVHLGWQLVSMLTLCCNISVILRRLPTQKLEAGASPCIHPNQDVINLLVLTDTRWNVLADECRPSSLPNAFPYKDE